MTEKEMKCYTNWKIIGSAGVIECTRRALTNRIHGAKGIGHRIKESL